MNTDESINAFMRHLRALWRAEMLIAEIKLGLAAKRGGLFAAAATIGLFGLGFLNAAAYLALAPAWGDALAMALVALADLVIAGLLAFLASWQARDAEIALAGELRDQALEAIELDARIAADEVSSFVRRPVQIAGTASSAIVSIVAAILRARRRNRD